jgi:endonuclease/exonuclease/phosphatase family metal-dependent hydrolase
VGRLASATHRLTVASTHLDFSSRAQKAGIQVILERIKGIPWTEPLVLAGDFNSTPGSVGYRLLTAGSDGFNNPFSAPYPETFHGFGRSRGKGHIDWILCRGPLETISCKVVTDTFGGRYPSDHHPVTATFRLDGTRRETLESD